MNTDPIADFLTRLRNANRAGHATDQGDSVVRIFDHACAEQHQKEASQTLQSEEEFNERVTNDVHFDVSLSGYI